MATDEQNIMRRIMLAVGAFKNVRIFRNNTGTGWVGERVAQYKEKGEAYLVLKNPRPLKTGLCLGSSDLIGFVTVTISPEMIGRKVAIFTALEVKTKTGRATTEQRDFISMVQAFGGLAGIPRNEQDAIGLVQYGKE